MGEYVVGKHYRAGPGGVVITWTDGSTNAYSAHELFFLKRQPRAIKGRLVRPRRRRTLEYEAPTMIPER